MRCGRGTIIDVLVDLWRQGKQSAYDSTDVERGISLLDPAVAVEWPLARDAWVISERDADAPTLARFEQHRPF